MMYPILCKVRYETLHLLLRSHDLWIQLFFSFVLNWIIAPLFMVGLAWAFLPDQEDLREGLIYVGIARCIAMVLIWTDLAGGDGDYCAVLVAFNSILQIILFAPFAVFYLRVVSHDVDDVNVSYPTVATSVAVFLGKTKANNIDNHDLIVRRNTSRSRYHHAPGTSKLAGRETISDVLHSLHWTALTNRSHLHHHRALCFSRRACGSFHHLRSAGGGSSSRLLPGHVHSNRIRVLEVWIWLQDELHAELYRSKQQLRTCHRCDGSSVWSKQ